MDRAHISIASPEEPVRANASALLAARMSTVENLQQSTE